MMLLAGAESAHGQRLIWLGTLGGNWSSATGVSADGSVVVGRADDASGQSRAFRWTAQTGMQDLGNGYTSGVSADGSIVVGYVSITGVGYRAFRWTASGGMQDLGTLPGYEYGSSALGVSADGSVVVGGLWKSKRKAHAFRWTASGGMQDMGTLGGDVSLACCVSADGSVVVGMAENASGQIRVFRWTAESGMQDLGTLGESTCEPFDISANGSVVVGVARTNTSTRAFRWTAQTGFQDMGTLGGYRSYAHGVTANGMVVIGAADNAIPEQLAFWWDKQNGMQDLNQLYAALLQDGSVLSLASAISPDGRYIVGQGSNARTGRLEAYLLDTQGTSSADDGSEGEVMITISPQPVSDHGWVHVRLGRFEQARVEVRDVLGRLVTVLGEGVLGDQRWQLPQLAAGVYTVMVRSGQNVAARQFVVTR
jgi:probable HAF family extracellular repeat protein